MNNRARSRQTTPINYLRAYAAQRLRTPGGSGRTERPPGACRWRLHRLFATREVRFAAGAGREDPLACFLWAIAGSGRQAAGVYCSRACRLTFRLRPTYTKNFRRGELFLVQVSFRGGSSWHCPQGGVCGVHDLPTLSDGGPLNQVNPSPSNGRRARRFDAEIVLASATPSPPACGRRRAPSRRN